MARSMTGVKPFSFAGLSIPVFWLGLVLQLLFSNTLGWLPSSGRASFAGGGLADRLAHLVMPVTVLAVAHAAGWSRYLRVDPLDCARAAFATPRARASRVRIVLRHAAARVAAVRDRRAARRVDHGVRAV
jgi:peptide/nickel transport system permease protein